MKTLLEVAGREFLKAFGAAIIILAPGVLQAPDLNQAVALGVASLFGALAAGLKAVQGYVPKLTFASLLSQPFAAWVDAFTRGFLAAGITSAIGILFAPDLSTWKAAATAALVGAVVAGFRALEGVMTKGEAPFTGFGLK